MVPRSCSGSVAGVCPSSKTPMSRVKDFVAPTTMFVMDAATELAPMSTSTSK